MKNDRERGGSPGESTDSQRGQLVLLTAVAFALALVPLVGAYLQLGYAPESYSIGQTPAEQTTETLGRSLNDAATLTTGYDWADRKDAAAAVRTEMESTVETVESGRLDDGIVYQVSYNETRTAGWSDDNCPFDQNRQFGACRTVDGIALQERDGRTHALAVAFDIEITTPNQETTVTTVLTVQPD